MPATTPKGFPYPLGTDPVADGDDAIKSLAQKVDTAVGATASGEVTVTTTAGTPSNGSAAVTFPAGRFTTVPRVFLQPISQIPPNATAFQNAFPSGVTTSGFTCNVRRDSAVPVIVSWFATNIDV